MPFPDPMHLPRCSGFTARGLTLLITAALAGPALQAQNAPPDFVAVRPQDVQWKPHPIVPGAHIAVLLGDPAKEGPYAVRMRFPPNSRVQPHSHPEARSYTVLTGEWKLGFGERFDEAKLQAYLAGSLYRLPANVAHFQVSGDAETVIQIQARGPSATVFVKPPGGGNDR